MTRVHSPEGIEIWAKDGTGFRGYACMDCDLASIDWGAEDSLWAEIMGEWDAGHICPSCFMLRAHAREIYTTVVRCANDE